MWALFVWLWNGLKALAGLILPVAGHAKRIGTPVVRWALRVLLLALLWAALWFLNSEYVLGMARYVPAPPLIGKQYLPVLGMLVLGWVWLGWYLWKLMTEPVESDFPDVDAAWAEGLAALEDEGIDLAKVPIFLVLGRAQGGETALIEAAVAPSGRPLRVRGVPRQKPVRVYATEEAVYVTCAGASVSGRHAGLVARLGAAAPAIGAPPGAAAAPPAAGPRSIFGTMKFGGNLGQLQQILAGQAGPPSPEDQRKMRELLGGGAMSFAGSSTGQEGLLVRDEAELEEDAARLEHLCRLIARRRQPELPVKGIMMLIPWAGAGSEEAAAATAEACRRDLAAARAGLRVSCPVFAMVCDMETAPGFRELVGQFREDRRRRGRVGRKFPLLPDLAGRGPADMITSGLAWFCTAEFPTWIYEFFALEQGDAERPEQTTEGNVRLYQILAQLLERHERVSRVLTRALAAEANEPVMFGGCYLAATGADTERDQAFVAAVFHRLAEEHKNTSWTRQAVAEDARQRQQATWGLATAGACFVLLVGAVVSKFLLGR